MTNQRFTVEKSKYSGLWEFHENGLIIGYIEVAEKLNELNDENTTKTAKIDRLIHQRNKNEEHYLKAMSYLHDNYYSIWEEVLKELGE